MRWLRLSYRLLLFFSGIFTIYFVIVMGRMVCQLRGKSWIGWRNVWVRRWARFSIWLTGGSLVIKGHPPKPPFVLVTNHLTYVDVPTIFASVDAVFVSKIEVQSWPVLGRIVAGVNTIFVDRSRRGDVLRVNEQIAEQLDDRQGLVIFPEGTSTEGADVLPFKPSLLAFPASQGLPVHFATIVYRTPPGEIPAHIAVCWGLNGDPFLTHLFRFFSIKSYEIEISYGAEPVVSDDRKELAQVLYQKVCDEFVPSVIRDLPCKTKTP